MKRADYDRIEQDIATVNKLDELRDMLVRSRLDSLESLLTATIESLIGAVRDIGERLERLERPDD